MPNQENVSGATRNLLLLIKFFQNTLLNSKLLYFPREKRT